MEKNKKIILFISLSVFSAALIISLSVFFYKKHLRRKEMDEREAFVYDSLLKAGPQKDEMMLDSSQVKKLTDFYRHLGAIGRLKMKNNKQVPVPGLVKEYFSHLEDGTRMLLLTCTMASFLDTAHEGFSPDFLVAENDSFLISEGFDYFPTWNFMMHYADSARRNELTRFVALNLYNSLTDIKCRYAAFLYSETVRNPRLVELADQKVKEGEVPVSTFQAGRIKGTIWVCDLENPNIEFTFPVDVTNSKSFKFSSKTFTIGDDSYMLTNKEGIQSIINRDLGRNYHLAIDSAFRAMLGTRHLQIIF